MRAPCGGSMDAQKRAINRCRRRAAGRSTRSRPSSRRHAAPEAQIAAEICGCIERLASTLKSEHADALQAVDVQRLIEPAERARSTAVGTVLVGRTAEFIASVEGHERGCVDGAQPSGSRVPDDDRLPGRRLRPRRRSLGLTSCRCVSHLELARRTARQFHEAP
jgi:hypothetical protein